MPGKGKGGGGFKHDEVLTGVLLADDFSKSFHPIPQTKCLIKLANEPLIHYSLSLLHRSGVEKIIVFCKDSDEEVKRYLEGSTKWANLHKHGKIEVHGPNPDVNSVGDVFRKLDTLNINDDFIFVPYDVVCNTDLSAALQEHKQRKSSHPVDKNAPLLTVIMTDNVSTKHELRQLDDDVIIAYGTKDQRLHHFGKTKSSQGSQKLPMSLFKECKRLTVNYQVLDSGVWICSKNVIEVFNDNFDYETQNIFVKRVIESFEFLGKEIHVHLLKSDYCCRVNNLTRHHLVQCDVINRKIYPLLPETFHRSMRDGEYNVDMKRDYLHTTCKLSSAVKGNSFMVGPCTSIDCSVTMNESAVAGNCRVVVSLKNQQ